MSRTPDPPLVDPASDPRRTVGERTRQKRSTRPPIREGDDMRADSAERRAALPSGVYFVQSGAFVKIGHASDVVQRVAQAGHAWNPHEVTPLGWLPAPDDRAAFQLERRLHIQFAAHRYRCEWFHAHESLLAFIVAHAQPWPTPEPRG